MRVQRSEGWCAIPDPLSESGQMVLAAIGNGRHGIELDPKYQALALDRTSATYSS